MTDLYGVAKKVFDENIAKIELSYSLNKAVGQDYICKTPEQTLSDGYGFCSEQVKLNIVFANDGEKVWYMLGINSDESTYGCFKK